MSEYEPVNEPAKSSRPIYMADPEVMMSYYRQGDRRKNLCLYGCCCVIILMVAGIVAAVVSVGEEETDQLYFDSCMDQANATPGVGPAVDRLAAPFPGTEMPNMDDYPIWRTYFEEPELYHRLHLHVLFLQKAEDNTASSGLFQDAPDAILRVKAKGDDTGSSDFFEIGTYDFDSVPAKKDTDKVFEWDHKAVILYKFGTTDFIEFRITDQDTFSETDNLMKFSLPLSDLPAPGEDWSDLMFHASDVASDYAELEGARLAFYVKVATGFVVTESDMDAILEDTDEIDYREHVLDLKSGDHALAQHWKHTKNPTNKAVLWVIGRNDGFMHPHVAKELFFSTGNEMDLFVLNWRFNGQCLGRGFIENPYYNSHNPCGDANLYNEELDLMLELMQTINGPYDTLVGYGHSTGATLLLNYLIENGDDAFDGFLFNGPLLDWDQGTLNDFVLRNVPPTMSNSQFLSGPNETPEEFQDNPLMYLGKEIAIPEKWTQRVHQMYYSEWTGRVKYSVPVTVGFARSANSVFDKIGNAKTGITTKPVLVLTSKSDPSLSLNDIVEISSNINKDRMVIEYKHQGHDVFLSSDFSDSLTAIADAKDFFKEYFY